MQDAWARGQALTVHGLVYALEDGLLRDLGFDVRNARDLRSALVTALNGKPRIREA